MTTRHILYPAAIAAFLLQGCSSHSSGAMTPGCTDSQDVTPNISGSIDVNLASPQANAMVALQAVFQLSCDQFDITDSIQLASVTLADATAGTTLATLNVSFPASFDTTLVCSAEAVIPGVDTMTDLTDGGTSNATLAPLCGKMLTLDMTIARSGCSGTTTQKTSSAPFQLSCSGATCGGNACNTNEVCCMCQGTPTCLSSCSMFGCM